MGTATPARSTSSVSLTATEGPECGALFNSLRTVTLYGDCMVLLRMSCIRLPAFLEMRSNFKFFYVLLTVHLSIILDNDQRDAHLLYFTIYLLHSSTCSEHYMLIVRRLNCINPYPTALPYGNGMVLHFFQQQESSTTKTVHKVINKGLKTYV